MTPKFTLTELTNTLKGRAKEKNNPNKAETLPTPVYEQSEVTLIYETQRKGNTLYHTSHRFKLSEKDKAIGLATELARMLSLPLCNTDADKRNGIPTPGEYVGYCRATDGLGRHNGQFAVWATVGSERDMYTAYGYLQLHGAMKKDY